MCSFLSDLWEINGNDFDSFREELQKFEKRTCLDIVNMADVYFLSVSDLGTGFTAVPLHSDSIWKKTKRSLSLKQFEIDKSVYCEKGYDELAVNEAFSNGLFMAVSEKKLGPAKVKNMISDASYVPVSDKAMSTISNRISHSGYGFFSERLIRDLSIVKKFDKPVPVSVISRIDPDSGLKKVFAVMSKKYTAIPQTVIIDVLDQVVKEAEDDMGKAECAGWTISHSLTRIYIEFPEAAEDISNVYKLPDQMIPGLMLETSDIGDCSLRVKGYFKFPSAGTVSYMENEYSRIHSGEINIEELLKAAKHEIFPRYTQYPEHLAKLMMHDVVDASMAPMLRTKKMASLYRKISKDIGLVKAIGKAREKNLLDQLIMSINPEIIYTAYDVAMTFLTLAKSVETENKGVIEAIAKTAPAVMKYDFGFEEEEDDLLVV